LQKTKYNIRPMARMRAEQLADLGLQDGDIVVARQDKGSAVLKVRVDNHVAKGCVRVAAAHPLTAGLGDLMGDITIEKASADQVAIYEKQLTEMA